MNDENRKRQIVEWQNRLHDAFDYNGILGSKFLAPIMDLERLTGSTFVQKFHGHRLLTDAFLDFYAGTMQAQLTLLTRRGWPAHEPYYAMSFLMHVTMFRAVRATEILSVHGYPLQGYALQRSIKDQVFVLCAAANNMMTFAEMFGWEGAHPEKTLSREGAKAMNAKRMKAERAIRSMIIGQKSGLSPESQDELLHWEELFNLETHRGLFTLFKAIDQASQGKLDTAVGPSPDETDDAMFINRSNELNWMIHRLIPYMRFRETTWTDEWRKRWELLDESFRLMNEGFAGLGRKIPIAHREMMQAKFNFSTDAYYSEPNGKT